MLPLWPVQMSPIKVQTLLLLIQRRTRKICMRVDLWPTALQPRLRFLPTLRRSCLHAISFIIQLMIHVVWCPKSSSCSSSNSSLAWKLFLSFHAWKDSVYLMETPILVPSLHSFWLTNLPQTRKRRSEYPDCRYIRWTDTSLQTSFELCFQCWRPQYTKFI